MRMQAILLVTMATFIPAMHLYKIPAANNDEVPVTIENERQMELGQQPAIDERLWKANLERVLVSTEYQLLRRTLRAAIDLLDNGASDTFGNTLDAQNVSDMPFYVEYLRSILNGDISRQRKRSHRKRDSFDSISHQSGLGGGLGDSSRPGQVRKAFSFDALFPYLLEELRRSTRGVN